MRPRPQDFFGPQDWTGGDPLDDEARITREQAEWDEEYRALPWWRRLIIWFTRDD